MHRRLTVTGIFIAILIIFTSDMASGGPLASVACYAACFAACAVNPALCAEPTARAACFTACLAAAGTPGP